MTVAIIASQPSFDNPQLYLFQLLYYGKICHYFLNYYFSMNPDITHFQMKLLTDVYSLVLLLPLHSQGLQPSPPQLGKI